MATAAGVRLGTNLAQCRQRARGALDDVDAAYRCGHGQREVATGLANQQLQARLNRRVLIEYGLVALIGLALYLTHASGRQAETNTGPALPRSRSHRAGEGLWLS